MFKKSLLSALCLFFVPFVTAQSYVVYDFTHNRVLESRSPNSVQPIASVTKLMTAVVFLENNKNDKCTASITEEDYDYLKGTGSKLPQYTPIACSELLKAMFIHSDNYAAHALARSAGMSRAQFIKKMNQKAQELGMNSTHFIDSSGLSNHNVSSVMDLVKLAKYSLHKTELKNLSNTRAVYIRANRQNVFMQNTNKLVREEIFDAALSKTGYIRESGYNLVFVNKHICNNATIGVISLNNASSASRSNFTKNKLESYGCATINDLVINDANDENFEAYDEQGMDRLIKQIAN
ncbi:D-alanyl-D-alanine carboxypeptidase family protein [Caviibacterium pharyngocola]|uniref:D-alanyl-D-alanine endopeptidase n=1 Tax=Caviibacterium pharyngocola TaxID=28159 RepID=A0A2M8RU59_9PAST|nr:serine hydrolase [Caviibacterium pharyngocola]PJG82421.1 D-alanyl-D-alanine endopeptidase [Caviibacterium pharyngocola]